VIELVNPNDTRAIRNKDNILALYDLMITQKETEQAVAKFFAPKYIQYNPLVRMVQPSWPGFSTRSPRIVPICGS
jgi:predicted SnoaL-like aldol condensation-catalyzing enzyme